MKDLIIGDCHFGVKSNSVQWLESQLKFFEEQVVKELQTNEYNRVIFLGDLFDIRYAINQQIGYEVKCLIRDLSNKFLNTAFYFVAGNHDYYSPDIKFNKYNAYNLLFGYEFLEYHPNVFIIQDEYLIEEDTVFTPWYWTENRENFEQLISELPENVKVMYCHSDLSTWPLDGRLELKPKNLFVISGHIHNYQQDEPNHLFNIGSIFPINFSDVNTKKYFYRFHVDDLKFEEAFENITTPKFIQFSDEDIFTLTNDDVKNCYVRLFIKSENINKAQYIERLTEIKKTFDYMSLKIHTVNTDQLELGETTNLNSNIANYIENNIPENLKSKYEQVKSIVESNED